MRKSFEYAKNIFQIEQGILRASEAKRAGIDLKTLQEMAAAGILIRESRGIYRLASLPPLSNPDLVQIAIRVPQSVICLISALSFHALTTQTPYKIYIAIPRMSHIPHVDYPPVDIVRLGDKAYRAGIDQHKIDGVDVKIYNREKTVADCFKFRNKIGLDVSLEALKDYLSESTRDIEKLLYYARIDRVEKVIMPYVEALV